MTEAEFKAGSIVITDLFVMTISGALPVGYTLITGSNAEVQLIRKVDNNV